ncbi:MAG: molybdate ABC transporter substrate-binding protein [bacterium]
MRPRHLGSPLVLTMLPFVDGISPAATPGVESHKGSARTLVAPRSLLVLAALVIFAAIFVLSCGDAQTTDPQTSVGARTGEIVVSAAADLSPVLAELAPLFEKESGLTLKTNLGSTGQLMEQIAAGARVDVFLAASTAAIDQLGEKGLLVPGSDQTYGRGRLVMWIREGSSVSVQTLQDLTAADVARVSLANPDHAPYGRAAREALQSAGLWDELQPKLVPAENVRQAFQFAESGNADVGLVALSLVVFAGGSYTLVPEELHAPIDQALAIVASSTHQSEAKQFIAFLHGERGREILLKYGFVLPDEG